MLSSLLPVLSQRALEAGEVRFAMTALLDPVGKDDLKADFLTAWAQRGETAEELAFCADALLPHAIDFGLRGSRQGKPLLDCCGTGGGGLNLFNVSTGLMFLLAVLGIPVVKHGNRGLTKKSGSADVLEALGIRIDLPPQKAVACLDEIGCTFLFAPAYHPGFTAINPTRRLLAAQGRRTVFNLLGPLLNPARPDARLIGVFKDEHVSLYQEALKKMGCPRFTVACGYEGKDRRPIGEVSARGETTLASTEKSLHLNVPNLFTGPTQRLESLLVENAADSARRLTAFFRNEDKGLGRELLVINATVAAVTHGTATSIEEGVALATEALDSGRVLRHLQRWQEFSARI